MTLSPGLCNVSRNGADDSKLTFSLDHVERDYTIIAVRDKNHFLYSLGNTRLCATEFECSGPPLFSYASDADNKARRMRR